MLSDSTLKAIFFDAAGTLIYLPRSVGEHYREVIASFGVDLDADTLNRAFRKAWAGSPPRKSGDGPRPDDDKGWWRELVNNVFAQTLPFFADQEAFDAEACFEALYAHFTKPGVWAAYPEVMEVLKNLRERGLKLGVISNFDRRLYPIFDQLGLSPYFERIIISSEVGADKPDPRIFRQALEALDVTAAEAWHVGDDPERDWGAGMLGLRVFRLDRPAVSLLDFLHDLDHPDQESLQRSNS
jgi:putative hydrolase of the HAD superfamily